MAIVNKIRSIARSFLTKNYSGLVYRSATIEDVDNITRRAIKEGWHVGPYDFHCGYAFDPKGFYMCESQGELVSHGCAIRYPKHSSYVGGYIMTEKFKGRSHRRDALKVMEFCDNAYTVGGDMFLDWKPMLESFGFERKWNTYIAMLSLEKVVTNLAKMKFSSNVTVKSIHSVNLEKLLNYDLLVFGTGRKIFIEKWINIPGSFGFVAVDEKSGEITGYAIIKQVIRGGGTEIGLAVAPLYADNAEIAKRLLRTTAEYCLSNEAVPKTTLEMFHPVGDNCGQDAPQLMNELEAELTHIGYRMYNKGLPPGRQLKKIYGIASPTFD